MKNALDEAVKKYQTTAVVAAILVHFFIFVTAIVVIVLLKQPLSVFITVHAGLQAATVLNAVFGHKIYRRYLMARLSKNILIK